MTDGRWATAPRSWQWIGAIPIGRKNVQSMRAVKVKLENVALVSVSVLLAVLLAGCGGPGRRQRRPARAWAGGRHRHACLQRARGRGQFRASPDGIGTLDLASHGTILWSHIDRRNASQAGYAGCDAAGYCWEGLADDAADGIDDRILAVDNQTVTLANGVTIPRPVILPRRRSGSRPPTARIPARCLSLR